MDDIDRWWERLDPPPIVDEWMARQVVFFHEKPDAACAGCSEGRPCSRLAEAREFLGDGSTTEAGVGSQNGSTVRR